MAIGYVGIPGSGKTHDLVQTVIIPSLQQGKTVYTNIPLNTGNLMRIHHLTVEQINGLHQIPDETGEDGRLRQPLSELYVPSEDPTQNVLMRCVIVHDEIQGSLPFDERRSNLDLKRCRNYIEHHRHYDVELHWASQSEHLVDVTLRRLTDTVYLYRNLKHTALGKLSRNGRYRRRLYMMSDGEVGNELIEENVVDINPRTFMCYKSFVGNETAGKFQAPMPKFLRNGLIIAGVLSLVIFPITAYKTIKWYRKITNKEKEPISQTVKQAAAGAIETVTGAKPDEKPNKIENQTMAYDGYFFDSDRGGYILCLRGIPVGYCPNPLFQGIGNESCGEFEATRVEDSRLLDGSAAIGPVISGLPTMDSPDGH